jgi:hypothetical protein
MHIFLINFRLFQEKQFAFHFQQSLWLFNSHNLFTLKKKKKKPEFISIIFLAFHLILVIFLIGCIN